MEVQRIVTRLIVDLVFQLVRVEILDPDAVVFCIDQAIGVDETGLVQEGRPATCVQVVGVFVEFILNFHSGVWTHYVESDLARVQLWCVVQLPFDGCSL